MSQDTDTREMVNHPDHYNAFPVEVIDIIEHMTFNTGTAVKYLARLGLKDKNKVIEDLQKATFYVQRETHLIGETPEDLRNNFPAITIRQFPTHRARDLYENLSYNAGTAVAYLCCDNLTAAHLNAALYHIRCEIVRLGGEPDTRAVKRNR